MIITDSSDSCPDIPGGSSVRYQASRPTGAEPRVFSWQKSQELRAGNYVLRDHHFQIPANPGLEVAAEGQTAAAVGKVTHQLALPASAGLEIYDYPGGYAQRFDGIGDDGTPQAGELSNVVPDGQRTAAIRMQEETASTPSPGGRRRRGVLELVLVHPTGDSVPLPAPDDAPRDRGRPDRFRHRVLR